MSVRARLTITVALVTAVLVAAGTVIFAIQLRSRLSAQTDDSLRARADVLTALLRREPNPELPSTTDNDDARHLSQILTPDGSVVASDGPPTPLTPPDVLERATRSPVFFDVSLAPHGDREMRALAAPTSGGSDAAPIVVVAEASKPVHDLLIDLLLAALAAAVIAIGVASAGAWIVAGAALSPVERLRRQAAQLSATDTNSRLDQPSTGDELTQLTATLNDLLDRLHTALRRERQLVADTAHELRTPLAALNAELELADRPERHPDELRHAITAARHDATHLSRLAENLLFLTRADEGAKPLHLAHQPIAETIERALTRHRRTAAARNLDLTLTAHGDTLAPHDPDRLEQVIDNLVTNTLEHATGATRLDLTVDGTPPDHITITATDNGSGFPPAFLPYAFQRFRRGDQARTGPNTGLGLAIAHTIIELHHGTITANNTNNHGARLTIRLLRTPPTPTTPLPLPPHS